MLGECRHLLLRHVADEREHRIVLAIADFEFANLTIEVRLMLTPDHRHRGVGRYPILAVTGIAKYSLPNKVLSTRRGAGRELKQHRDRRDRASSSGWCH